MVLPLDGCRLAQRPESWTQRGHTIGAANSPGKETERAVYVPARSAKLHCESPSYCAEHRHRTRDARTSEFADTLVTPARGAS